MRPMGLRSTKALTWSGDIFLCGSSLRFIKDTLGYNTDWSKRIDVPYSNALILFRFAELCIFFTFLRALVVGSKIDGWIERSEFFFVALSVRLCAKSLMILVSATRVFLAFMIVALVCLIGLFLLTLS